MLNKIRFFLYIISTFLIMAFSSGVLAFSSESARFDQMRYEMVESQIKARGIRNPAVLEAMRRVKRHEFIPEKKRAFAYGDSPLPIGLEQTISQPFIVAFMTEALDLQPTDRVLEIGTGSGYQAAVLAEIVKEVYTIEIIEELAQRSQKTLQDLGYENIRVKHGDGYEGWPEQAPFDAIIVTAAPPVLPPKLLDQLKNPGGRMIVPVGEGQQELILIKKTKEGPVTKSLLPVRFVPMVKSGG